MLQHETHAHAHADINIIFFTCKQLNATGDWKIESAEDIADKMTCNLYQRPESLEAVCDKISTLDAAVVAELLESKPQVSINKCLV